MLTADLFFQELVRLNGLRPRRPTLQMATEGSEWANSAYHCQSVYWAFDAFSSKNCGYIDRVDLLVKSYDCDYSSESELLYECVDAFKCYNSNYLEDCANMTDSYFSVRCNNCQNVFGCVNLKNKSYCIFNRQLTEQQYKELLPKFLSWKPEDVLTYVEALSRRYPWTQTHELGNQNTSYGNYIYYNKNCYLCFDSANNENGAYLYDAHKNITCFDIDSSGNSQLSYEVSDSTDIFNCNYIIWSGHCQDSSYLIDCGNVKNSFGCTGLKNKQHCILNRQFTKEEYEKIVPALQEEINQRQLGWGPLKY